MKIIEHNDDSRGEIIDGLDPYYGEYDEILDILDFPLESLGDDNLMDWDASNSQDLGPIPLDAFMGFYQTNIGNEYVNKVPRRDHNALISIESEQKAHADLVVEDFNAIRRSGSNTSRRIVMSPETSAFQTSSPISVLESSGSCSSDKSLPISFETIIPVRARSKRGRPSSTNQWFTRTPITGASIKAKKKPRTSELLNTPEGLQEDLNRREKKASSMKRSVGSRSCTHCNVTTTPQWREGPLGKNTLCNACGVRYRTGRLFPEYRPAASPTFTPSLHSNLHKEVINRRKNAIHEAVQVENPTQGQFVPIT